MLAYPARLVADTHGLRVSFRDIPEALTSGTTREHALEMAQDALITAMDFYLEDRRPVPPPSPARRGEVLVELPANSGVKVLLLNEMIRSRVTPAALARGLGVSPQTVNRIVDVRHPTKIDTLAAAFRVMGKSLRLEVV